LVAKYAVGINYYKTFWIGRLLGEDFENFNSNDVSG
jgi:hypothetical protein